MQNGAGAKAPAPFCYTAAMKIRSDISYGIIPVRWVNDGWEVLLIHQYSKIGKNSYWVFPKGHPEGKETPIETAKRELQEETGLSLERIIEEPHFQISYTFTFKNELIQKQVIFFIGEVVNGELALHPEEVVEARWLTLFEAGGWVDYDDTKTMFAAAKRYLEDHPKTG